MRNRNLLAITLLATIAFPSSGQDVFSKNEINLLTDFQVLEPNANIKGYPILPVAENLKHVFASISNASVVQVQFGNEYAVQHQGKSMVALLAFTGNLEGDAMARSWTDNPCGRSDLIWKRPSSGYSDHCVTINHNVGFMSKPTGVYKTIAEKITAQGIEFPSTIMLLSFTRFDTGGKYLSYTVSVNPEHYGFERDSSTIWRQSVWHKDRAHTDPRRAEFLQALFSWSESVHARMNKAFEKNAHAFSDIPTLEVFLKSFAQNTLPGTGSNSK